MQIRKNGDKHRGTRGKHHRTGGVPGSGGWPSCCGIAGNDLGVCQDLTADFARRGFRPHGFLANVATNLRADAPSLDCPMNQLSTFNAALTTSRLWLLTVLCLLALVIGQASLPVTDRDEALFVQASRQMVQDGAWVDIRFQDVPRYKKPVGIYWMQSTAARLSGMADRAPIWVWRLPSLLAAFATTLMVGWFGSRMWGRQNGAAAALLFASLFVLAGEARIATTDAVLMALIVTCQIALAHLLAALQRPAGRAPWIWVFWLSMGVAVLVKGPIAPMVVGLTAISWALLRRDIRGLRVLWQPWAVLAFAAIVLPWVVGITFISGGAFWKEAVVKDFLSKAAAGQEGKGLPPGSYLVLMWLSFWPASVILPMVVGTIWRLRGDLQMQFLLCWLLPSWLVFEAVPTKLFHYTMPLYPALAILVAMAFLSRSTAPSLLLRGLAALAMAAMAALVGAVLWFQLGQPGGFAIVFVGACIAAVLIVLGFMALWRGQRLAFVVILALTGAVMNSFLLMGLARTPYLWPSYSAMKEAQVWAAARGCAAPKVVGWGFTEPSLVWLGGRDTLLLAAADPLPDGLVSDPCTVVITAREADPAGYVNVAKVQGMAVGAGRPVALTLYQPKEAQ